MNFAKREQRDRIAESLRIEEADEIPIDEFVAAGEEPQQHEREEMRDREKAEPAVARVPAARVLARAADRRGPRLVSGLGACHPRARSARSTRPVRTSRRSRSA